MLLFLGVRGISFTEDGINEFFVDGVEEGFGDSSVEEVDLL